MIQCNRQGGIGLSPSTDKHYIVYDDSDNNIYFQLLSGTLSLVVVAEGTPITLESWGG